MVPWGTRHCSEPLVVDHVAFGALALPGSGVRDLMPVEGRSRTGSMENGMPWGISHGGMIAEGPARFPAVDLVPGG